MHKPSKKQAREKKISDLLALVNGELTPAAVRGQKQLISIDWGEESDGNDDWNIFLIDGKRVNRSTFDKEMAWRAGNKK